MDVSGRWALDFTCDSTCADGRTFTPFGVVVFRLIQDGNSVTRIDDTINGRALDRQFSGTLCGSTLPLRNAVSGVDQRTTVRFNDAVDGFTSQGVFINGLGTADQCDSLCESVGQRLVPGQMPPAPPATSTVLVSWRLQSGGRATTCAAQNIDDARVTVGGRPPVTVPCGQPEQATLSELMPNTNYPVQVELLRAGVTVQSLVASVTPTSGGLWQVRLFFQF